MKLVIPIEGMTKDIHLPGLFLRFIGVAEMLGAIGLILHGLLLIRPELTPLAAAGLVDHHGRCDGAHAEERRYRACAESAGGPSLGVRRLQPMEDGVGSRFVSRVASLAWQLKAGNISNNKPLPEKKSKTVE